MVPWTLNGIIVMDVIVPLPLTYGIYSTVLFYTRMWFNYWVSKVFFYFLFFQILWHWSWSWYNIWDLLYAAVDELSKKVKLSNYMSASLAGKYLVLEKPSSHRVLPDCGCVCALCSISCFSSVSFSVEKSFLLYNPSTGNLEIFNVLYIMEQILGLTVCT